jgi:glutathione reductase (NADPH)
MAYDYDLFVIGAGSGGIASARRAAEYGAKVAVAEFDRLGGTCVNRGCVPKKLMVYSSRFPEAFHAAAGYGWTVGETKFDWRSLVDAVEKEVTRLNGIYGRMLENSKVTVVRGRGRLVDAHTVAVGDETYTADKILIAVGGEPVVPEGVPGIEHAITSNDIFSWPTHPKRLVVLGGGYIGCEFAAILNGLGTEVTQIIRGDRLLRGFDDDIRAEVQGAMERHGIRVLTGTTITSIEKTDDGLKVTAQGPEGEVTTIADAVGLAATGRRPLLTGLGIENTKVQVNRGAIVADEFGQTAEPNIFAVGDCTDRVNLTPVAIAEGRAFSDTHFGGKDKRVTYDNIPTAIFTSPEASTVGMTEAEAVEKYGEDGVKVYRSRFRAMYYTLPDMEEKTLMKLIVHKESDRVLGAHMVGDYAAEIIQGVAIAVKMGATKADFDATVAIHPSSAEEFVTMR